MSIKLMSRTLPTEGVSQTNVPSLPPDAASLPPLISTFIRLPPLMATGPQRLVQLLPPLDAGFPPWHQRAPLAIISQSGSAYLRVCLRTRGSAMFDYWGWWGEVNSSVVWPGGPGCRVTDLVRIYKTTKHRASIQARWYTRLSADPSLWRKLTGEVFRGL